ncbi:MAG: hypothetical protein J5608_00410 [Alphaproteobacteria bacterium]|nr:hypothetical protein [Alphaproteobacteria bacterium]
MRKLLRSIFVGAFCAIFALPALAAGEINHITGRIVDAKTHALLPGATVYVEHNGQKPSNTNSDWMQQIFTDDAKFELWHVPQEAKIVVMHNEYHTKTVGQLKENMGDIPLEPKARVLKDFTTTEIQPRTGTVISSRTNKPVSGVRVTTKNDKGKTITVATDSEGRFTINDVVNDGEPISFSALAFLPSTTSYSKDMRIVLEEQDVNRMPSPDPMAIVSNLNAQTDDPMAGITPTQTTVPTFTPNTLNITGTIVDTNGNPIDGATIQASDKYDTLATVNSKKGSFNLSKIPDFASLTIKHPKYHDVTVQTVQKNMKIIMEPLVPSINIAGTVVDISGLPVEWANIIATNQNEIVGKARSVYDGIFNLTNIPKTATLNVTVVGYHEKNNIPVSENMKIVLEPVMMKELEVTRYYGNTIDGMTKQPLPGVYVMAANISGDPVTSEYVTTNDTGAFELKPSQFPEGSKILFTMPGYRSRLLTYTTNMQVTMYTDEQLAYMPGQTITFPGEPDNLTGPNVPVPTLADPYATASITTIYHSKPNVFNELDSILTNKFQGSSVWKNEEGKFNTARLASDSIAGVVLGTVGGVVTSTVIKKNQLKKGFEDLKCTIGGQDVASFGDEFSVTVRK